MEGSSFSKQKAVNGSAAMTKGEQVYCTAFTCVANVEKPAVFKFLAKKSSDIKKN